ncbi:Cyclin-D4-1 [Hibiscus syriacus]|uniref:Cyclin-D4-1 n=1 Tax=Hibiscus syriacus TaxID=106335 RepID=A0A6A2WW52_HIBSY|nr:cyclin-D4-2-like [Hibiscus syriacus]XP_039042399.1 cyclin-D4-2-like [Hibiscus syriacus]KAE8665963.1 Cyclin-D4-1 [Hibiscus syriacus]
MAENLDCSATNLLCTENTSCCFDGDLDFNAVDEFGVSPAFKNQTFNQNDPFLVTNGSTSLMGCPGFELQSDDVIKEMVEKEMMHLPGDDYLKRLRTGDLDLIARRQGIEWICKASAYFSFGHLSICLSINYLDRFLSMYGLPRDKTWTIQLLAVACLSIAAKMEETMVPSSVNLQVGEPKFVFEAKTIQRMELLVLSTLKWRMQVLTPCSFIDHFLSKLCNDQYPSSTLISRSLQLILNTIRGIDLLEFRPSEIAAAVAVSVSLETRGFTVDKAISSFIIIQKERVLKCVQVMKDSTLIDGTAAPSASCVPQSPIGVLDGSTCLSYKSDEAKHGLFPNSCHPRPDIKRRKLDNKSPQLDVMFHET